MKPTQILFVRNCLEQTGEVTRNQCLQNFVSRLAAIIAILKKEGWQFATESRATTKPDGTKGRDFVYRLVMRPPQ